MSKELSVDWSQLEEMGVKTLKNSKDFEDARLAFKNIVNSLDECWEGKDASSYKRNCNNFLDLLKNESIYLESLSKYFNAGSKSYSTVIEEEASKIERMNEAISDEEKRDGVI